MGLAITFLMIAAAVIIAFILWIRHKHNYWKRRNIETTSMSNFYLRTGQRSHPAYIFQNIYKKLKDSHKPYGALYSVFMPNLLITDLDLLKFVFITEFQSFPDRGMYTNYGKDPLSKNLVRLHGDLWKKIRSKMTPTFTTGKMKQMFGIIGVIGERFVQVTQENVEQHHGEVEIKDLCARFTTDIIGRVAFGLECNSLRDPLTEFRVKGDKAFYTIHPLLEMFASEYPKFFNFLGLKVFTNELIEFYGSIVRANVEYRIKNRVEYNDFLDILIELMDSKVNMPDDFHLDMDDVIAQAFVFFIGGFETSSSTISYAIFELAHNPAIQQKTRDNIIDTLGKYNGDLTYESLNEMWYVRQVVQETLRKNPVAPTGRRICRQTVTFPPPSNLTMYPGEYVLAPVYAIHHDPEHYPQPNIFRPERFSAEEKEKRHPMAYMPFGAGPRICIAERFGMMVSMLGVALLIMNFQISCCSKTPSKLTFDSNNIRVFAVKDELFFKLEKIQI